MPWPWYNRGKPPRHNWSRRPGEKFDHCTACPIERWGVPGPQGGQRVEYRAAGAVLASGPRFTIPIPPCPVAPEGAGDAEGGA